MMMRSLMRCGWLAAGLLAGVPAAHATAVFNNLGASSDGSDEVFGSGPLAQSFTATSSQALDSVTLSLFNDSSAYRSSLSVLLLANNGGAPGAVIATIGQIATSTITPGSLASYTVYDATPVALSAGSAYWVELSAIAPLAVEWSYSDTTTGIGVAGTSAYSAAFGVNPVASYGAYQMSVDVPEPVSLTLLSAGLLAMAGMRFRRS